MPQIKADQRQRRIILLYQLSVCEEISAFSLARKRSCNAVYLAAEGRKGHNDRL